MLKSFKKNCKRKERKILSWKKNSDRSRSQWVQNFKGITSCVRGPARGGPMSPVWILKHLMSVFTNACCLLSALPSLSQFGRGRLSLVEISFYVLSLLFGPSRLSEFTLAGPCVVIYINFSLAISNPIIQIRCFYNLEASQLWRLFIFTYIIAIVGDPDNKGSFFFHYILKPQPDQHFRVFK